METKQLGVGFAAGALPTLLATLIALLLLGVPSSGAAQTNVFGSINADTTWTTAGSPYLINADVTVAESVTLTIQPGVDVRFSNAESLDVELIVAGTLRVQGTAANPVTFQSQTLTTANAWEGIRFTSTGAGSLTHLTVRHADDAIEIQSATGANFTFDNVVIETFRTRGIHLTAGGTFTLAGLQITGPGKTSSAICIQAGTATVTVRDTRVQTCGNGVSSTRGNVTVERTIFSQNDNGLNLSNDTTTASSWTVRRSTFWDNNDAVEMRRTSSSTPASFQIETSILQGNGTGIRDTNTSWRVTFNTFRQMVYTGASSTVFVSLVPTIDQGLNFDALLADPAAGDFAPTERSPARYFGVNTPADTVGAVPYAGAPTPAGLYGFWYGSHTFSSATPYVLTGDMVIAPDATVTFAAGTSVQVATGDAMQGGNDLSRSEIRVLGTLRVEGTTGTPIVMEAQGGAASNRWTGVRIEEGGVARLASLRLRDAATTLEFVRPVSANATLTDVVVERFTTRGVWLNQPAPVSAHANFVLQNVTAIGPSKTGASRCMESTGQNLTVRRSRVTQCGDGILVNDASLTVDYTIVDQNGDGLDLASLSTTSRVWNVTQSTFYDNTDAIEMRRASSSTPASLAISYSVLGLNGTLVRDTNTSWRTTFSTFSHNVYWAGTTFSSLIPTITNSLQYDGLLADPAAGDFAPTERSPARYFNPADGAATLGAVAYTGAPTEPGLFGFWYGTHVFDSPTPYSLTGDMVVAPGANVRFGVGAQIAASRGDRMAGGIDTNRAEIRVEGELVTDGTITRPIVFRSGEATPARGDWYGIVYPARAERFGASQFQVSHAVRGVSVLGADVRMFNVDVSQCSNAGIYADDGILELEEGDLDGNTTGVRVTSSTASTASSAILRSVRVKNSTGRGVWVDGSNLTVSGSLIFDNATQGLYIENATKTVSRALSVSSSTIAHNGTDGLAFRRGASSNPLSVTLNGTSITHNARYGVFDDNTSWRSVFNCAGSNAWGNTTNDWQNLTSVPATCVSWNPLYADEAGRDYAPTRYSPLRGLGPAGGLIGAIAYSGATRPELMGFLWDNLTLGAGAPWQLAGDLYVADGGALTLESGTVVRVARRADGMGGGASTTRSEVRVLPGGVINFPATGPPVHFQVDFATPAAGDWNGVTVVDNNSFPIRNVRIDHATWGLSLEGPRAPTVTDIQTTYSSSGGIQATDVRSPGTVDILAATIIGTGSGTGAQFTSSSGRIRSSYLTHHVTGIRVQNTTVTTGLTFNVIHNTVVRQTNGISYGRGSSSNPLTVNIDANLVSKSSTAAVVDTNSSWSTTDNHRANLFFDRTTVTAVVNSTSGTTRTDDPLIEDDDWDNFPRWWDGAVWFESPAINAVNVAITEAPSRDIRGRARSIETRPDIGAFEYDPTANKEPRADAVTASIMVARAEPFTLSGTAATDPDGTIASAFWTFSDGTLLPGLNVTHQYNVDRAEWAYITVIDNAGAEDHARVLINVNSRPVAVPGTGYAADAGIEAVCFDREASFDTDGGSIVQWSWNLGDGSPAVSGRNPCHTYTLAGVYEVTLTVTDNEGLTHSATTIVTILGPNDSQGPLIQHTPVANGQPVGVPVVIGAELRDVTGVAGGFVRYRRATGPTPNPTRTLDLVRGPGDRWEATIPGTDVTSFGVSYWIEAIDTVPGAPNQSTSPSGAPGAGTWTFTVSGDGDAPVIVHTPVADNPPAGAITVSANITDATGVGSATLVFRVRGGGTWGSTPMALVGGGLYTANIPAFLNTAPGVDYYIEAADTSPTPNVGRSPSTAPTAFYSIRVSGGDLEPPGIAHTPISGTRPIGASIVLDAQVVDAGGVASVQVLWRRVGAPTFETLAMTSTGGSAYRATLPGSATAAAGQVEYYLRAEDVGGNTATSPTAAPGTTHRFDVADVDVTAPVIVHTPIANGQIEGVEIDVSATITDDRGVASATLHYRRVSSVAQSTAMVRGAGDTWAATIPDFAVNLGTMEYWIRALDAAGNVSLLPVAGTAAPFQFTVVESSIDLEGPVVVHTRVADGQPTGVAIAISAVVFDEGSALGAVELFWKPIAAPTFQSLTMTAGTGGTYTATIPGASVTPGGIAYYLRAADVVGNTTIVPAAGAASPYTFTVITPDSTAPSITHTPIVSINRGEALVINATITDAGGVQGAVLRYAFGAGAFQEAPMVALGGNSWRATLAAASIPGGATTIRYSLVATDAADNVARLPVTGDAGAYTVNIIDPDVTPPTVSIGTIASPAPINTALPVSITATDASGIASVRLSYASLSGGAATEVTATGTGPYAATVPAVAMVPPGVRLFAQATDSAGNTGVSSTVDVVVQPPADLTPPTIVTTAVPDGQTAGSAVIVAATITDTTGVASARLYYRTTGAGAFQSTAMSAAGDRYTATIPAATVAVPGVQYYVEATDSSAATNIARDPAGAPATFRSFTVTAADTAGPTIAHTPPTAALTTGQTLALEATVTDPAGVSSVSLYWQTGGSTTWTRVTATRDGDVWSASTGAGSPSSLRWYWEATDALTNTARLPNDAPTGRFSVPVLAPDTVAPSLSHTVPAGPIRPTTALPLEVSITDASGIASGTLRYRTQGETTFRTLPLTESGGSRFTVVVPAADVAVPAIEYWFEATDSAPAANVGRSPATAPTAFHTLGVVAPPVDNTPPAIVHTPLSGPVEPGTPLMITAQVTDASGLAAVQTRWRVAGATIFQTLTMTAVGNTYSGTIPGGSVVAPGIEYSLVAVDASPASNTAVDPLGAPVSLHGVEVRPIDRTPPSIAPVPVAGATLGQTIRLAAAVSDASGVAAVTVFVRGPTDSDWNELPAALADEVWAVSLSTSTLGVGEVRWYVRAVDAAGNTGVAPATAPANALTFLVTEASDEDFSPPAILHTPAARLLPGAPAVVVATVTDASGVDGVWLWWRTDLDENWEQLEMSALPADQWRATVASLPTEALWFEYWIEALDGSANGNVASAPEEGADDPYAVPIEEAPIVDPVDPNPDAGGEPTEEVGLDAGGDTVSDVDLDADPTDAGPDTLGPDASDVGDDTADAVQPDPDSGVDIGGDVNPDGTLDGSGDTGSEDDVSTDGSVQPVDSGSTGSRGGKGGCAAGGSPGGVWGLLAALLVLRRRRRLHA